MTVHLDVRLPCFYTPQDIRDFLKKELGISGALPPFPAKQEIMNYLKTENRPTKMIFAFSIVEELGQKIADYIAGKKLASTDSLVALVIEQITPVADKIEGIIHFSSDEERAGKINALAVILVAALSACARAQLKE